MDDERMGDQQVDQERPAEPRLDDEESDEVMSRILAATEYDDPLFGNAPEPGSAIEEAAGDLPDPDPSTENFDDARAAVPHQP
jgi:hypothetical protein